MELLERELPLKVLDEHLAHAEGGSGRVVLVSGEAGIGKTSLVERFLAAHRAGARTFRGACDALFTPRPLGPLRDMALEAGGALLADFGATQDRHSLFSAVVRAIRDGAAPAIVVIEDLHWADEATLDLVKFLGRRVARLPALIVLTYRDDEVDAAHPLRSVLGDLPRDAAVRIPLEPLSEQAVGRLAGVAEGPAREDLFRTTGGNPFFVTEALAASGHEGVPTTVRDAVLARASRLGARARAVLEVASLSPVPVEPWLVEACVADSGAAIDECVARGMLRTAGAGFAFRHEIARLAVRESLPPSRRVELERAILAALRAHPQSPEMLSRLAHHAEAAGEPAAVLEYACAAGRRAAALGAHREAFAHFDRALRYAGALPEPDRATLLDAYANECQSKGDMEQAILKRREAAEIWRTLGMPKKQGETLCRMMVSHIAAGQDELAKAVTKSAVELLEPLGPSPELALAYRTQSALCMFQRDNADAIAWGWKAVELAQRFDARDTLASSLNAIGSALLLSGDEAQGIELLERSLAIARESRLESHITNAYGNLGSASGEVHRFEQARGYLLQGIEFAREHDLDYSRLYATSWLALADLHLGRWNEAGETALTVLRSPGSAAISRIMALVALGRLRVRRGDPGASEALAEAAKLAQATGTLQRIGPVAAARAEAAWMAREPEHIAEDVRTAYALALAKRHPWFAGELAYWQWKAGSIASPPEFAAAPFRLQMEGRSAEAAAAWRERGCAYEAARALAESSDEEQLKQALLELERLEARPAVDEVRERLRALGARSIPRGPRSGTRANAFGLTARELEVLALLRERLTNAEIARRLHRSEKTVGHHVSAILAKLNVASRDAAAQAAHAHDLLPK